MRQTQATIRSTDETEKDRVVLEIEVPVAVVEQELDRVYRKLAHDIVIPGFRRGKAPRSIIELRVGKEAFYAEAQKDLVHDAFVEALLKTEIKPLASEIVDVDLGEGKPLVFKVAVTKEPVLDIDGYKGVAVKVRRVDVGEAQVTAALDDLRNRYSKMILVKDRPAETGDVALLEFAGYDASGAVIPKASEKNFRLELGSGQTIPGFEAGVVGMALGEERDVDCVFPENYNEKSLAGQKVRFHMKLKELKRRQLPDLTDDFAKELGEHETLDALKASVRDNLAKAAEERMQDEIKTKVIDHLIAAHEAITVPEPMIDSALDHIVKNLDAELRQYRQSLAQILQKQGKTIEEFRTDSRPRARRMALADILLGSIAARESIVATEPDVAAKITEWADSTGTDFAEMRQRLEAEGTIRMIRDEIVSSKVKDLLARQAVVEYTDEDEPHVHDEHCHHEDESQA